MLIEATNFYLFERNVEHARLEDLKAYALIFGVKDEFHETVARLSQMVSPTGTHPSNSSHGAPSVVAFSLASQPKASEYLEYLEESIEQRNLSAITSTFFGWAVYCGHTALVSLLFSERVIWYDDLWEELTNEAVMRFIYYCGNEATAQLVLESVLKVPYREKRNFITMLVTAQAKDEKGIGLLLRRSEALKNTKNGWGDSALHIAAERGRDIIVRELLELGWDIDAKGNHGDTPLLAALRSYSKPTVASEPTVAVLLENGASVNGENDRGMRTTHAALTSKLSKQTVQLILEKAFEARLPPKLLQPKGKRRRAEVVVTMDRSLCADIFVDSYHASIERVDRRWHSVGYDAKYLPLSLVWVKNEHLTEPGLDTVCHKFGIIFYACPNTGLDISIRPSLDADIFTSSEVNERWLREWKESHINKQIRFQIVNGGEVSIELESCIDCHSFEAIATDPNAEVVESDVESDIDEASEEGLTDDPDAELVDLDSNLGKERMSNLGWDD